MTKPPDRTHDASARSDLSRRGAALALAALFVLGCALYAARAPSNPPGFFIDESSIAYNAHLVATTGRDEHGEAFPLYFRAFGDYKNPTYVYMLAALFRVTGPGIAAARYLSAALGVLTALLLGLLGARVSGRRDACVLLMLAALLTPWLFELSRVVLEVAMYPATLALFLLCAWRASRKGAWGVADASLLAATLALLTYTYSIGRLYGPLLALGLVILAPRARLLRSLLLAWGFYALALVPMLIFRINNPGALTTRFHFITYITPQGAWPDLAWEFLKHYAGNVNPWRLFVSEHSKVSEIIHIPGAQPLAATTAVLAAAGVWLLLRRRRGVDRWWRFVFYGLAAAVVPASLTNEYFHMLRLAAVPVFLVVLTIPALAWLAEGSASARRAALAAFVVLTLAQGAVFQWQYHASARTPQRMHVFDADYPSKILPAALAASYTRPIYFNDTSSVPGYIQAFWYATIQGIPHDKFGLLPPDAPAPEGSVVITTEDVGPRCRQLAESEPYTVCLSEGPPRVATPLTEGGFRAELRALDAPSRLRVKEKATVRVVVRNAGNAVWLARERAASPFQVSVGNHWLDTDGRSVTNDDGRALLMRDLRPGEETEIPLVINAPARAGDYLLELDMLQEGVSWFALKGSKTLRVPVRVE